MPRWGDEPEPSQYDPKLVALIAACSDVQEPARRVVEAAAPILKDVPPGLSADLQQAVQRVAEVCELLGPSTARLIRNLVPLLGNGGET